MSQLSNQNSMIHWTLGKQDKFTRDAWTSFQLCSLQAIYFCVAQVTLAWITQICHWWPIKKHILVCISSNVKPRFTKKAWMMCGRNSLDNPLLVLLDLSKWQSETKVLWSFSQKIASVKLFLTYDIIIDKSSLIS